MKFYRLIQAVLIVKITGQTAAYSVLICVSVVYLAITFGLKFSSLKRIWTDRLILSSRGRTLFFPFKTVLFNMLHMRDLLISAFLSFQVAASSFGQKIMRCRRCSNQNSTSAVWNQKWWQLWWIDGCTLITLITLTSLSWWSGSVTSSKWKLRMFLSLCFISLLVQSWKLLRNNFTEFIKNCQRQTLLLRDLFRVSSFIFWAALGAFLHFWSLQYSVSIQETVMDHNMHRFTARS